MTELAHHRHATDTQLDGDMLVPADVHHNALTERDALLQESTALRQEVTALRARKASVVVQRETRELRELLETRERELRRLKDSNLARERLLLEERTRREQLEQQRATNESRSAMLEAGSVEQSQRAALRERDLVEARRAAEELRAALAQSAATLELRDRALRELGSERVTLASERDTLARGQRELEEALLRAGAEARGQREQLEATLTHVERALQDARVAHTHEMDELEREATVANADLGRELTAVRGRVEQLEREGAQLKVQRDRFARKLSVTFEQLVQVRREAEAEAEQRGAEWSKLATLAGELSWTLVVQGAALSAHRNGRTAPTCFDVDEALSLAATNMPDFAADALWRSRDSLLAQLATDAAESLAADQRPSLAALATPVTVAQGE